MNMRLLRLAVLLAATTLTTAIDAADKLHWPRFGSYELVRTYTDYGPEVGKKPIVSFYKQYKSHFGDFAGILWVYPKTAHACYYFLFRHESYNRPDSEFKNLQLISVTDSSYTQRWRNDENSPWVVEEWKRTLFTGTVLDIVNTLQYRDCTNRLYGYYEKETIKDTYSMLILSDKHAIEGKSHISDPLTTGHYEFSFKGDLFDAAYPDKNHFSICSDTYTVPDSIMGKDYLYYFAHKLDGNYDGMEKSMKDFYYFTQYNRSDIMVIDKENVARKFLGETDTTIVAGSIEESELPKADCRLETWRAEDGKGWVYAGYGKTPVRSNPDNNAKVIATLYNPGDSEMIDGLPCLGIEGNWFKVKVKGKTGYVYMDNAFWDSENRE